ncbi:MULTISPECIES: bifunctional DNA primase/polymerase [unclassified Streptomyces]|uniref:bifunctional DNA primase/polymerase n=1 Tax=Streptomycetaceae TaxID=2062 RepID=UPI002E772183|nr:MULTISPECIES: bifunctional DNA primase/polymerase [unclassified Streptomyces]MED7953529.1 bifunctional DNA primase/polymerase [Streptomyces sp. BE303]MEE1823003.1 bifunctional DNA primase/polymerase [Streptomyces sp. BE20]
MESGSRWTTWWQKRDRERARAADTDSPAARLDQLLGAVRAGFPLAPAAHPAGYRCSCDRVACPAPARHPVSFAWQTQATTDPEQLARWLSRDPQANFITATGRAHDVLDVPAEAGRLALERLTALGVDGPVAAVGEDRYLFFTATRGTPVDEDEWWPSALDSTPDTMSEHPGLRWHCRGSYTLLPPAALPDGSEVRWLRGPEQPLPDSLRVLDVLTDACTEVGAVAEEQWLIG